jgi:hypothetical protein
MRRYGAWGGAPKGYPENPERCIVEVPEGGRSPLFYQCRRNRGKGPNGEYCGIHAAKLAKGKPVSVPPIKQS